MLVQDKASIRLREEKLAGSGNSRLPLDYEIIGNLLIPDFSFIGQEFTRKALIETNSYLLESGLERESLLLRTLYLGDEDLIEQARCIQKSIDGECSKVTLQFMESLISKEIDVQEDILLWLITQTTYPHHTKIDLTEIVSKAIDSVSVKIPVDMGGIGSISVYARSEDDLLKQIIQRDVISLHIESRYKKNRDQINALREVVANDSIIRFSTSEILSGCIAIEHDPGVFSLIMRNGTINKLNSQQVERIQSITSKIGWHNEFEIAHRIGMQNQMHKKINLSSVSSDISHSASISNEIIH